jgi:type IV pilus assembly protein PilB
MTTPNDTLQSLLEEASKVTPDQLTVLRDDSSPIAQVVNLVLEAAIHSGTSAVHIEPRAGFVQVRYRIDGLLRNIRKLPHNLFTGIVARIKVLADLQIDEQQVPQSGRFELTVDDKHYSFHVSTLPVADGEKMVLTIHDEAAKALAFEELGYWGESLKAFNQAVVQPHGLIIVSGMIGSGVSTNLYSILNVLNNSNVNIATVEDPIAYRLPGTNQTRLSHRAGISFASGLRAILRQDANVIMVSDVRDGETANLLVQAAGSGRLVIAGFRASGAAAALAHLVAMNTEPYLLASTMRTVVGRRLVRHLCTVCRQEYKPSREEVARIFDSFGLKNKTQLAVLHKLELQAAKEDMGGKTLKDLALGDGTITRLFKPKERGCEACAHSGYKGMVGICEVLPNSDIIQRLIVSKASAQILGQQAVEDGMVPLGSDGFVKMLRGETSAQELLRVLQS